MRVKLGAVHLNRWGEGKIHILTKESQYTYTRCGRVPYFKDIYWGDIRDASCRRCYPQYKAEILQSEHASV